MSRCSCGYRHAHIPHDCGASGTVPKPVAKKRSSRPENMCANCPSDFVPCRKCWVRAGYNAGAYERAHREIVRKAIECGYVDTSLQTTPYGRQVLEEARKEEAEKRSGLRAPTPASPAGRQVQESRIAAPQVPQGVGAAQAPSEDTPIPDTQRAPRVQ